MFDDYLDEEEAFEVYVRKKEEEKKREKKKREHACIPGHLSQPIYGGEIDMLLSGSTVWSCFRHKKIAGTLKGVRNFRELHSVYNDIEEWLLKDTVTKPEVDFRMSIIKGVLPNYLLQRLAFTWPARDVVPQETVRQWCKNIISETCDKLSLVKGDLWSMMRIEKFKDSVCFKEIRLGEMLEYRGGMFERDISILPIRGQKYAIPTALVLCCADKIQSLFGLRLYWLLTDIHKRYPGYSILETGDRLIRQFRNLRSSKLQGFFGFCAGWEPLIVGDTIAQGDDEGDSGLYINQYTELGAYLEGNIHGYTILDFLPPPNCPIILRRMWLELTGMVKIFGYPILKEDMLLDQLKAHGVSAPDNFSFETMRDVMGIIKRDFVLNYRDKTGRYPPLRSCPSELHNILLKDKVIPRGLMTDYSLWNDLEFKKVLEFDYSPDLSDITKDSAAAVPLSQWPTMFDRCAFEYHYGKPPPYFPKGENNFVRVIDAFLNASEDYVRKIVRAREAGRFDPEDRIIVQCGKELEHKEDTGRAFTKQTPPQRFFQVVLEMNIAEGIFRFVPEQSMTDGEVALANRQMAQFKSMGGKADFISMDLTKWCLRHRSVMVEPIGQMYDQLFGLNGTYETSHDFFVHCNVFCNSRMSPPNYDSSGRPIPGPFYMNNFVGGCEGLHQKKWTHITIGVIKLAMERSGVKGTIMGQGDNQIVIINYDKSQLDRRSNIRKGFLTQCESLFLSVGHKLKRQETWYSSQLHEYGKLRTYKGCTVSQGTKKSTKLIPDINDGLFALSSSISTLNTLTEAIAKGNPDADVAFMLNQILLASYFVRKDLIWGSKTHHIMNARCLLMFPTDFGGISLSTFHSHSVRGHDDPVTLWLALYKIVQVYDSDLYNRVMSTVQLIAHEAAISAEDRTRLYEDPRALRVKTLPSAESKISELSLQYLKSHYVTNPAIRRLYESTISTSYNDLVATLDTMDPIYPSLANVILKDSNAGIGKSLQSKFTSVKSIERSAQLFEQVSLIQVIEEKNTQYREILKRRGGRAPHYENISLMQQYTCATELADFLRRTHWGRELVGVTKPPHTHQVILRDYDLTKTEDRSRSVLVKMSQEIREKSISGLSSFGPFKGYVGSRTKVKVKPPSISITEKTSYSRGLLSLGRTLTWMELIGNEGLAALCRDLMNEKLVELPADLKEEDLKDVHETVLSGNPFHRLSSQVESTTSSINGMITVTSHFSQSSNLLQAMSRDGEDYSIFFQYVYSANIAVLSSLVKISGLPPALCAVLECRSCTSQLPEPKFSFSYKGYTGIPSVVTPKLSLGLPTIANNLGTVFAIVIGMELAKNVDLNFRTNHNHGDVNHSGISTRTTKISINDFKRLDLLNMILSCIVYSTHCGEIIIENKPHVMSETNDLSFTGLAHLILESDRRAELFTIIGKGVECHTMVTQAERMSAYISRNITELFLRFRTHISEVILPIEFKREDGWRYGVFIRLSRIFASHGIKFNRRDYRWGMTHGSIGAILSAFNISRIKIDIEQHEIVKHWRANPEVSTSIVANRVTFSRTERQEYPHHQVLQLYNSFSVDPDPKILKYRFLSFLARPVLNLSSAASKYLEILCMMDAVEKQKHDSFIILCIAEGSGGTLASLLEIFPQAVGAYNTLMEPEIDNRDVATDHCAPSTLVNGTSGRVIGDYLSTGQTDITTAKFMCKLEKFLNEADKPIGIVTMDAESMNHSDNLNHVENLLPILYKANPRYVIFKMFYSKTLPGYLNVSMSKYPNWTWTLFKPVSSDPISHEIFLVCTSDFSQGQLEIMKQGSSSAYSYLEADSLGLTCSNLNEYVGVSRLISGMFKRMFVDGVPTRGDRAYPKNACGLLCINTLHSIVSRVLLLETSTPLHSVKTVIRAGGKTNCLFTQLHSFIFLYMYLSKRIKSLNDKLISMSLLTLPIDQLDQFQSCRREDLSLKVEIFGGSFFQTWGEAKFYVRHIHDPPCQCISSPPPEMFPSATRSSIHHVVQNLYQCRYIFKDEFPLLSFF